MVLEGIIGSALGGAFRLAPEFLKHFDKKNDRAHELEMLKAQMSAEAARSEQALKQIDANISVKEMEALIESAKAGAPVAPPAHTGIGPVDAFVNVVYAVGNIANMLVRPTVTYWLVALYSLAKYAIFVSVTQNQGMDWTAGALAIWGADDMALLCSVMSYWFLDRSLRKMGRG